MSHAPSSTGHPPRPAVLPALVAAAVVAVAGFGVLVMLPPHIALEPRIASENSSFCIPVDALAVAQHDFAIGDDHHVLLVRLLDDQLKAVWQSNDFSSVVRTTRALDVDGDGAEEVCQYSGDSTAAFAWALGADRRERLRIGPLRDTSERPDVPWDGQITLDDAFELRGRRVLVCRLMAGFSRRPRGVTLADGETRARLWTFDMGALPVEARAVDLDGDGTTSVLVTTASPDNGVDRNGSDDGHAYAIALDADGHRRWQVELGGAFSSSHACVLPHPVGHDTPRVVATFSSRHARGPEPGRLVLIDARSGQVVDRHEFPEGLGTPRPLGEGDQFAVGSVDGWLRVFDHGLRRAHERRFGPSVEAWGCTDLDGDGEVEIVASTPTEVLMLERDCQVRARLPVNGRAAPVPVGIARAGAGRTRLAVCDGRALIVEVLRRPRITTPADLAVVAGFALIAGFLTPVVRRVRRKPRPAGAAAREFLLDYHQIRHETFEKERPFARVRLWAQASAVEHPLPADALAAACSEFEGIGHPTVRRYAERAAALHVEGRRVRSIRRHAARAASLLREARYAPEPERLTRVTAVLAELDALASDCYEAYWEVVTRAPCRPSEVVAEAMFAKAALLDALGAHVHYEVHPAARQPVLFDRDEMVAIVGEIVENCARALTSQPDARIDVGLGEYPADPRRVLITLRDNGHGVPPEMRARLFTPEASTREGGGFGLYHAREVARRWLADLTLEEPPEGQGSEARLVVRACRVVDRRDIGVREERRP